MRVGYLFTSLVVLFTSVAAAPVPRPLTINTPAVSSIVSGGNLELTWTGGVPPYTAIIKDGTDDEGQTISQRSNSTSTSFFVAFPAGSEVIATVVDSTFTNQKTGLLAVVPSSGVAADGTSAPANDSGDAPLALNTPAASSIISGEPVELTWSGGTPPYSVRLVTGANTTLESLLTNKNITSTIFVAGVGLRQQNTSFKAVVQDSAGATQTTAPLAALPPPGAVANGTDSSASGALAPVDGSAATSGDAASPANGTAPPADEGGDDAALAIDTPAASSIVSGEPVELTWTGGTPPYSVALVGVGKDVPLQVLLNQSDATTTTFVVGLPVGTAFTAGVKDSTGAAQFTGSLVVAAAPGSAAEGEVASASGADASANGTAGAAPVNAAPAPVKGKAAKGKAPSRTGHHHAHHSATAKP